MAEIKIKRKTKPLWPWIVGVLVVLAIVVWLIFRTQAEKQVSRVQHTKDSGLAAKHLRFIPEVMITKLQTYLA